MLYRKAEADRVAQMQLEKHSQPATVKLMLLHKLIEDVKKSGRHPSLSNFVTTTTRMLTGKLVRNGTAPQVNG